MSLRDVAMMEVAGDYRAQGEVLRVEAQRADLTPDERYGLVLARWQLIVKAAAIEREVRGLAHLTGEPRLSTIGANDQD